MRRFDADWATMSFLARRAGAAAIGAAVLLLCGTLASIVALSAPTARPAQAAITGLPPHTPRLDLPVVLDGRVLDIAKVGRWIVVGGDFTRIRLQNGDTITQQGAFAYDVNSGALNTAFRPTFVRNGGQPEILAVEPGGNSSTVYLGGKFNAVNGHGHQRLTKMSLTTGAVDTGFLSINDGFIRDVLLTRGRLFVGGEFETINNKSRSRVAELDPDTGAVTPFRADITASTREPGVPFGPKHLGVTPDNTLVIAHRGSMVNGLNRTGIALVDLDSNTILPWRTRFWGTNAVTTIDAEVSPDGTYMVLGGDGGDFPFIGRDSAVAFSLTSKNQANQEPIWIARNFDSTYAVGISHDTVYLGGHFCWVESHVARDPYPAVGQYSNNNSCFGLFPARRFAPEVVYRDQIGAFDPETGHALDWDPTSNGLEGVLAIEVVGRGLLIGHDGDRFGRNGEQRRAYTVGRHAFIDITTTDPVDPSPFIDRPVLGTCVGLNPTITGTTLDDQLVGTAGRDIILAGPGNDIVSGGGGDDVICGGLGADRLRGDDGNDQIFGGEGRDRIYGGDGVDRILGQDDGDLLAGDRGNDQLIGGRGGDRLNGGAGSDVVKGGPGRDVVQGGRAADDVQGGIDIDRCAGWSLSQPDNPGDQLTACER